MLGVTAEFHLVDSLSECISQLFGNRNPYAGNRYGAGKDADINGEGPNRAKPVGRFDPEP
jgi:hypothetical protein